MGVALINNTSRRPPLWLIKTNKMIHVSRNNSIVLLEATKYLEYDNN